MRVFKFMTILNIFNNILVIFNKDEMKFKLNLLFFLKLIVF